MIRRSLISCDTTGWWEHSNTRISNDVVAYCCAPTADSRIRCWEVQFVYKVFLNEMLARGALVILSLFVAGFWSEVDCAGLLSGAMGKCEEIHFGRRPWTRPRQGFRHAQENCDRRHRRRSLERTHLALLCKVWSSLRSSASCLGQPLLRIESQRGPFWIFFCESC